MPRKSVEALAGAWWRQQKLHGGRPKLPKYLPADAAKLFDQIVQSRAPDLFMPGSLHLLEQFCMVAVTLNKLWKRLEEMPVDSKEAGKLQRMICTMGSLQCRLAESCALMPRHTHGRRSGVLTERYSGEKPWEMRAPAKGQDADGEDDALFGGSGEVLTDGGPRDDQCRRAPRDRSGLIPT